VSDTDGPAAGGPAADAASPSRLLLRVVSGDPTPQELAALLAVVGARSGGAAEPAPAASSAWAAREPLLRRPVHPGPGAWRASGLPGR